MKCPIDDMEDTLAPVTLSDILSVHIFCDVFLLILERYHLVFIFDSCQVKVYSLFQQDADIVHGPDNESFDMDLDITSLQASDQNYIGLKKLAFYFFSNLN